MPVKNRSPSKPNFPDASENEKQDAPFYPQWAENRMRSIENRRLQALHEIVREAMPEILEIVAEERDNVPGYRKDGFSDMVRRIKNRFRIIRDLFSGRMKADPLERDVRRCADYTDRKQFDEWQRSVRATLGIDLRKDYFVGERYELMLSRWVDQNVSFSTSIESSCFDEMESVIIDGFLRGRTPKAISSEIQRRFDVTKSKARLLARDQIGTLTADLTRTRHEAAGVTEYIWSSSEDERVRDCHRALNGKKFRYNDPPAMWYMTKHGRVYTGRRCNPGEDYQCRCVAKPVFDLELMTREAFEEKKSWKK